MTKVLACSAVIPTRQRTASLRATLSSLAEQSAQPVEIVVVDASDDSSTEQLCRHGVPGLCSQIRWFKAGRRGAAVQRNEGVVRANQAAIAFFDDDIFFEPECVTKLWGVLESNPEIGGVNAMITNQKYSPPGRIMRQVFPVLAGRRLPTYAGKVVGPAINQLPDDRPGSTDVEAVEWLNTTCTMYRRDALPDPPFPQFFSGYSMLEDLTLSLRVRQGGWKLANARTARIFHDSQPGDHKMCHVDLSAMELVNRHFVMTRIMGRRQPADYIRLGVWESLQIAAAIPKGIRRTWHELRGKLRGIGQIAAKV